MILPELRGRPIEIRFVRAFRDRHGGVHAGSFLRERRIHFDLALRRHPREFARIFVHEIFHFAWLRLSNAVRRSYEELIAAELRAGVPGELGWSAEWRKSKVGRRDLNGRTRHWREYVCESFCDTAAWLFAREGSHPEFTLPAAARRRRRAWFRDSGATKTISV